MFSQCADGATVNMLSCCPGEDTSTEARFVWHSDSDSCTFWYAKAAAPGSAMQATCASVHKPVAFRYSDVDYYKYTAELSDLESDTEYIYYVKSGTSQSAVQKFKTAGTSGSFNFLWMSDVHSHPDNPGKMTTVELLRQDAEARTASSGGIDFVLFSGDAVKYGSRYDNWQQWNGAPAVTNYMFAMIPGNKEYYYTGSSTFYDYYWYLAVKNNPPNGPSTTEREGCYWFLRDSVMFVGIDSLIHKGSRMSLYGNKNAVLTAQTNWFDRVVSSQQGKFRYLVVFQHDPWFVYAASKDSFDKSRGNYDVWRHVFDKHKVDLALSGDEHNYIRSKPLRGDAANSDGTIYMVAGQIEESNYSATITTDISSYGNANATKYFDCMGAKDASCGAAWIEVRPDSLKVTEFWDKWQSPSYTKYDSVTITPKNRGWVYEESSGGTTGGEAASHTRYRFAVDAPRSDEWCMQLSEIQLLDENGGRISSGYTIAYDSTTKDSYGDIFGSGETPEYAVDGNTSTKWLDWRAGLDQTAAVRSAAWLEFRFAEPTAVYGYRWYTADDEPDRTPVSWTFSASGDDGATWTVLDKVVGYGTTTESEALAYTKRFVETPQPPTTAGGAYLALCVGVDLYSNPASNLECCNPDVDNVLNTCTNSEYGLWQPSDCYKICDSNATLTAVRAQFQNLAAIAQSGDTVLYYQSSHGGNNVLCLHDKNYKESDFASDLMRFNTGVRVIVMLDACHSASMFKDADAASAKQGPWDFAARVEARMAEMREELRAKGAKASNSPSIGWMTACDYDQLSWGGSSGSTFTKYMVNAWKSAKATDANGDGYNDFLEIFTVAAPQATGDHGEDGWTIPQKLNDDVLANVAAFEISYHPPASDKWLDERMETGLSTGTWSEPVVYGEDGRTLIIDNTFAPNNASTGNVVAVELTSQFCEYTMDDAPDATAQAAVRLGTNGCFQVWTGEKSGVGSGGVGELGWVDVEAEGVVPVNGAEYTLRTTFDYSANTYSVAIKNNDVWLPLTSSTPTSSTPNSQLSTSSFPLAVVTNCVSSIGFVGETYFTSLYGEGRYEIIGFVANEALALSNNVQIVLDAAKATWLNNCAGGKATVAGAAAGLSGKDFTDAYLLNLDITDGDRSYTFEITDIDVGDTSVSVAVTLTRSGSIAQPINGILKFYGAATLAAFKDGASPLGVAELTNETFSGGETATATIPLDGETPPAFFKAEIEEE